MDQFATGVVGTRSPFGETHNAIHPSFISGGSSSGSAVAVALGFASFALGTDTGGSGRVPAAHNGVVGLKPTKGRISTHGVVPACRSIDCVSVFAKSIDDCELVANVMEGYDCKEVFSRKPPSIRPTESFATSTRPHTGNTLRVGIPSMSTMFFQATRLNSEIDKELSAQFQLAVSSFCKAVRGETVEVDYGLFKEASSLLFEGPLLAERYAMIQDYKIPHEILLPLTRQIIVDKASKWTAADCFLAMYKLKELKVCTMLPNHFCFIIEVLMLDMCVSTGTEFLVRP